MWVLGTGLVVVGGGLFFMELPGRIVGSEGHLALLPNLFFLNTWLVPNFPFLIDY